MKSLCIKLSLLGVLAVLSACKDDESTIADYPVYVKTSYSEYQTLATVNRCVTYTNDDVYSTNTQLGFGGICIFRDLNGDIGCCDLACPYENLRTVTLTVKMPYATCTQCGSKFDLSYGTGTPLQGPAKSILKLYTKIIDTGEYIRVSN